MKRILLLTLLLCSCRHLSAITYPSLESVATKLYGNYFIPEYSNNEKIEYQKKRDGWHIAHAFYDKKSDKFEVDNEELFWSSISGKYKELSIFQKGGTPAFTSRVSYDVRGRSAYDYERCPYYGYNGWDKDVILDYSFAIPANDTTLEGLGRAYSNFAIGYIEPHYSYHLPEQMNFPEKERVDLFIANEKKCFAAYDVLRKRNPHYEVLVGEITSKYANEIISAYADLIEFNRESELNEYFREDLYDPFMLSVARAILDGCAKNGILFTYGDNDTFPLWYLQWIKGVRTDVAVINISLLGVPKYIERWRNGFKTSPKVSMVVPKAIYDTTDYFMFAGGTVDQAVSPSDFFNALLPYAKGANTAHSMMYSYDQVVFQTNPAHFARYELLQQEDSIIIKLVRSYYFTNEMAMLDIIFSNHQSREIYTSIGFADMPHLKDYFFNEGMVKHFIPAHERLNTSDLNWNGPVASAKTFAQLAVKSLPADTVTIDRINAYRWITNYKIQLIYAADMIVATDSAAAIATLDKLYASFPFTNWKPNGIDVYSVQVYYKAQAYNKADANATALMNELESDMDRINAKIKLTDTDRNDKRRWQLVANMLKTTCGEHNRAALTARAEKLIEKYWRL